MATKVTRKVKTVKGTVANTPVDPGKPSPRRASVDNSCGDHSCNAKYHESLFRREQPIADGE